jgi:hypothetical protein
MLTENTKEYARLCLRSLSYSIYPLGQLFHIDSRLCSPSQVQYTLPVRFGDVSEINHLLDFSRPMLFSQAGTIDSKHFTPYHAQIILFRQIIQFSLK